MLDLTRISETIGGLLGQRSEVPGSGQLLQQLGQLGIDPNLLDGLNAQEVAQLLAEHGIDVAGIDPAQLAELVGGVAGNGSILESLGSIVSDRLSRS